MGDIIPPYSEDSFPALSTFSNYFPSLSFNPPLYFLHLLSNPYYLQLLKLIARI
jgi:hypothetical protein